MNQSKRNFQFVLYLIIVLCPIFFQLTKLPINSWDESRLAKSAYEMYKTGNFLIVTYDYLPDMWSTKPPFLIWLQCICMHLFGVGEFSVRFPTALAASILFISIFIHAKKYLNSRLLGFMAGFVLVTTWGFMEYHVVRTGDYDVTLILFMVLSLFAIFNYSETSNPKFIYLFFIYLTLGTLTKSIAALLFLPGIALYLLWSKKVLTILRDRHFYTGSLLFVSVVLGYYLAREHYNPGYIKAVMYNEVGGRYLTPLSGQSKPITYYLDHMIDFQQKPWVLLSIISLLFSFLMRGENYPILRRFNILISVVSITFFIVISFGGTKLEWYNAPLYPLLAILIGSMLTFTFDIIKHHTWVQANTNAAYLPYAFLLILYLVPYKNIWQKLNDKTYYGFQLSTIETPNYLKNIFHGKKPLIFDYIANDDFTPDIFFYLEVLKEKGKNVKIIDYKNLKGGETILTHQSSNKEYIHKKYEYDVLYESGNQKVIKIIRERTTPLTN